MAELHSIRGGKRVKAMAEARILECPCGSRTFAEVRTGVAIDAKGKTIHRGTLTRICAHCKKPAD